MIKTCVFDLDGTILYTLETIRYYINDMLSSEGLAPASVDECKEAVGNGARNLIIKILSSRGVTDGENVERLLNYYTESYDKNPCYLTKVYDGIEELISELKMRGIYIAVLSNKPDFATKSNVKLFFGDSFDIVLGGREGIPLKPNLESVKEILESLSVSPEEIAFVGDSEVDVLTAINIGAGAKIFVDWGYRSREQLTEAGAVDIVSSPREILEIIDNINFTRET